LKKTICSLKVKRLPRPYKIKLPFVEGLFVTPIHNGRAKANVEGDPSKKMSMYHSKTGELVATWKDPT